MYSGGRALTSGHGRLPLNPSTRASRARASVILWTTRPPTDFVVLQPICTPPREAPAAYVARAAWAGCTVLHAAAAAPHCVWCNSACPCRAQQGPDWWEFPTHGTLASQVHELVRQDGPFLQRGPQVTARSAMVSWCTKTASIQGGRRIIIEYGFLRSLDCRCRCRYRYRVHALSARSFSEA